MPDLPDVNENFTADNSDFIAKVQEMIDKIQELSDTLNQATLAADELHEAIDDLPDKQILITIEGMALEQVELLHDALDDLPRDKEIYIAIVGEALAQIEALQFALDNLPRDKVIDVTVVYNEVGKPTSLELPGETQVVQELDQGAQQALNAGTQALGQGVDYAAEVVGVQGVEDAYAALEDEFVALRQGMMTADEAAGMFRGSLYDLQQIGMSDAQMLERLASDNAAFAESMGITAEAAPLAADGVERLGIEAGDAGAAAEGAAGEIAGMGEEMDQLGSAERLAALQHAAEYLQQIEEAERAAAGVPPAGANVIPGEVEHAGAGIPIEDFFPEEGESAGAGTTAGDEFAEAAARAAETEAASAGMSDLARQMFGGPIEEDMAQQGEADADGWFKGLIGRLSTQTIDDDQIPHLPGVSDGKGAGGDGGGGGGGASAYSGMFEGVIVAAAALAPFIGQAISGAITAGLGFALAGIGVYAAMQLAPVKAAFKDFEDSAKNDLASIGKIFEPVMLSIFHVATQVFGVLTPVFAEAEKTIAGPFKVWADTFIKTFENPAVEASIEAVAKAFASILRVVTPELASMAEKFAGALTSLVDNIAGHPQATADFLNFLADIPVAILNVLNVLTTVAEYTETHPLFKDLLDVSAFEHMFNAIEDLFHGDFLSSLKNLGDVVTSTFESMGHIIVDLWDMLPEGLRHGTDQIVDDIRKAFEDIPSLIKGYWDDAVKAVSGGWDDIINALFGGGQGGGIAGKASGILGDLENVWNEITNATKTAWDDIKNAIMVPWDAAVGFVESLGNSFSSWWSTHGQALEEVWSTAWDTIKTITQGAMTIVEGAIRLGVGAMEEAWNLFWNSLVSTAKQAWAVIGPLVTIGWTIIRAAFQVGTAATEMVWNTLWSVVEAVARTAWDAVTAILKTGWDLIVGVFNIGMAAVRAVWNVLWSAIETVVRTIWDAVAALLKAGWDIIVGIFSVGLDVLTGHWSQAWNDIKTTAEQVWNAISGFFQQAFNNFSSFFDTVWNNIKNFWGAWWDDIKTTGEQVWNSISSFFSQAFNNFYSMFQQIWNNVKNFFNSTWDDIKSDSIDVWDSIMSFFDGIWSDIKSGFSNAVSSISSTWARLQSIFDGPVNFLIHTVYDDGIAKLWNDVAGVIPGLPHLPTLAAGGQIPGYGGGDIIPALLEPGETVVSKEHTRILAKQFHMAGVPGFASGGSAGGDPGSPAADAAAVAAQNAKEKQLNANNPGGLPLPGGGVLGDITGFLKDAASIGAAVLTGNTTALLNDLTKLIGAGGATGDLASMITGIPKAMIKALISEATSVGAKDAAALAAGPAGGATGSEMQNGAELYQYLLTNVFAGHKIAAAGAIASIWGECVSLDHQILTKRGYLNHDEVVEGDETMGYNPETDKAEWTPILRVVHYEQKPVITLYSGKWSSTFTPNHRWLTEEGMKKYTDLNENDKLILSREADTGDGLPISIDEAVYIGWLASRGDTRGHELSAEQQKDLLSRAGDPKLDALYQVLHMSPDQRKAWLKAILATDAPQGEREVIHTSLRRDNVVANAIELALFFEGYHRDMKVPQKEITGFGDVWCVTTELGSWTAKKDAFSFFTGNSEWNPLTSGTGGRGLIGWTPAGTISNAAFEGGMKTQEPAIIAFINSSGDQGVIREMESATSVSQAANEWGVGVERYGIDDVHAEGIALATSIMNSAGSTAPAQAAADAIAKAARGTQDAGGWLYPGMNLIENKTGQIERTYPPGQGPGGGLIHNVVNVDGKTIFEAVKPYVYQYNSRNSGNGRINGSWRPS